jgi:hypothetical protein
MGHIVWLLIVIPIIVYVLAILLKSAVPTALKSDDESTEQETGRRAQPTATDVERFLAEINRRKREAERGEARSPERSEPRRQQRSQRPQRVPQAPVVRRVPEEFASQLPTVQAVEPERATVADAEMPPVHLQSPSKGSPLLKEILPLLRSPRGRKLAVVLNEILGPPRCRGRM